MRICYIISTCDKYLDTRVKVQMEKMLKNVDKEDIYYLTSSPNHENRQFGWHCMIGICLLMMTRTFSKIDLKLF